MTEETGIKPMGQVIQIDEDRIRDHVGEMVRGTVEEALNAMLDAETDRLCGASRYERREGRKDTRAGHYERQLHTKAGDVSLKVPKLRRQTFETAIIERYQRRESSVEEALIESVTDYSPDARWQRCTVYFYRNVFSHVPSTKVREVGHILKAIHAQKNRAAATEKAQAVIAELRHQRMTKAADLVEENVDQTLTYYAFPDSHWIKLRTNNPLERVMREIRRSTRVVGAFPDGQSCLNLAAARPRHIAGTQLSMRRYMNMDPLHAGKNDQTGAAVA